jgi:predicted ribosome quality control (RQC) complex YloA/Tae2 family protein
MLYGLEFFFLAKELKSIEGYFIENFYELGKGRFRLKLSKSGAQANLLCVLPYSISIAYAFERVETPTNFSIAVRKRIGGFKITEVRRLNNDRIIQLELAKGDEIVNVIIELFGKGNFIVADRSAKIVLAYTQHRFSDRAVYVGMPYVHPKGSAADMLNSEVLSKALSEAARDGRNIGEALQKNLQIGKPYVAQILENIGISDEEHEAQFDHEKQRKFHEELKGYISGSKGFYLYNENGRPIDFSIGLLSKYKNFEALKFDTLGTTIAAFYESEPTESRESAAEVELKKSIEKQKALVAEIDVEISKSKQIADFIFANMAEINGIIEHAAQNKHAAKEELQRYCKSIRIKDVDLKNKTVTIEIPQ